MREFETVTCVTIKRKTEWVRNNILQTCN